MGGLKQWHGKTGDTTMKDTVAIYLIAACADFAGARGVFDIQKSRNDSFWRVAA